MSIERIQPSELEALARRIWHGKHWDMVTRYSDGSKCASFEAMGYHSMSTEFPMRSGEWVEAGPYEIRISYPKWDIPGYIYVRSLKDRIVEAKKWIKGNLKYPNLGEEARYTLQQKIDWLLAHGIATIVGGRGAVRFHPIPKQEV